MATGNIETQLTNIRSARYGKDVRSAIANGVAIAGTYSWGGNSLGTSLTSAQKTAISNGTFDGIHIGDYWTIDGIQYLVADFDYWYRKGDTDFNKHHVVLINNTFSGNFAACTMNATNITEGGYMGSRMYTETIPNVNTTLKSAFGDNLLTHRELLVNAVTDGKPSAATWADSTADLLNEFMVYGCRIHGAQAAASTPGGNYTIDTSQLKIFELKPELIGARRAGWTWLRDVVSSTVFAFAGVSGGAYCGSASGSDFVRVAFAVGV